MVLVQEGTSFESAVGSIVEEWIERPSYQRIFLNSGIDFELKKEA